MLDFYSPQVQGLAAIAIVVFFSGLGITLIASCCWGVIGASGRDTRKRRCAPGNAD